jgi:hypothetical protein
MLTTENTMNRYFVDYRYNTTGAAFQTKYAYTYVTAASRQEAIRKARKQAPNNATRFQAFLA